MIDYKVTPTGTVKSARVYGTDGKGFSIEAVQDAPDFSALIDTIEDELREGLANGTTINIKDLASSLVVRAKRDMLGELLIRLLCILSSTDNIQLDIEVLISAAGLAIRDVPDSAIAAKYGLMRQTFSARKKALMEKLGMNPPPHSKSLEACETYKDTNRRNGTIE
jgi:hypothetical protein